MSQNLKTSSAGGLRPWCSLSCLLFSLAAGQLLFWVVASSTAVVAASLLKSWSLSTIRRGCWNLVIGALEANPIANWTFDGAFEVSWSFYQVLFWLLHESLAVADESC